MKLKLFIVALFCSVVGWGQVTLTNGSPTSTIDFSSTVTGVSNGAYTAAGFQATPTLGQLDSDAWAVTGWSDGACKCRAGGAACGRLGHANVGRLRC